MKKLFFLTCLSLLVISCEELTGESTGANDLNNNNPTVGGVDAINRGDRKFLLQGTADNGGNAGHHFRLRFKLPEGKKVTFFFFVTSEFKKGALFSFSRTDGKVTMSIDLNGISDTKELTVFDSLEVIDLDIDFHNDHSDAHILVWDKNGNHEDHEECTFDGGCLYNSEDFAFDVWLGVGKAGGTFWGVEADQSLLLKLEGPLPGISNG